MLTIEGRGSRGLEVIAAYQTKLSLPRGQALIRLDGQYGNGAIVADLLAAQIPFILIPRSLSRGFAGVKCALSSQRREPFSQHSISMTQNDLLSPEIHFLLLRSLAEISLRIPWGCASFPPGSSET